MLFAVMDLPVTITIQPQQHPPPPRHRVTANVVLMIQNRKTITILIIISHQYDTKISMNKYVMSPFIAIQTVLEFTAV